MPADVPATITAHHTRYMERCLEPLLFSGIDDALVYLATTAPPPSAPSTWATTSST
ncbi:hypothetical protein ABYF32_04395 [Buchananella felis]|uniref:hypothetical protein n=1 Tax=Buchananella felis TaxID=3231492 RepID=UPI0035296052